MFTLRDATPADAAPLLELYRPAVESGVASFETVLPSLEDFQARIHRSQQRWAWLVAEEAGHCLGYAYASPHRERAAYRYSVETSAYVATGHHRRGLGRALYGALFERLVALGACNAYAGVVLPNEASVALHRAVGFTEVGVFRRVGWKFGAWHDVLWLQRPLRAAPLTLN